MLQVGKGVLAFGKAFLGPVFEKQRSSAATVQLLLEKHRSGHALSPRDRLDLASSAATWALNDPYQGQGVAILGEVTGVDALHKIRKRMRETTEGREILANRTPALPTFDEPLREGTVGSLLSGCVPEERSKILLIEDPELAFVMRRYRDAHDILHALTGLPVTVAGEVALKWFELASTNLPMATLSAVFGLTRVEPNSARLLTEWIPWAASAGKQGKFYLQIDYAKYKDYHVDEFREKIMGWPELPTSLRDHVAIREHYKTAIRQAIREGREPTAIRHELDRFERQHCNEQKIEHTTD